MKAALALLALIAASAAAQDTNALRIVDGKLYNSKLSKLWEDHLIRIDHVYTNGVVASVFWSEGVLSGYKPHPIFIANFPTDPAPVDGKSLTLRMIKTGTYRWQTVHDEIQTLEKWDCGIPYRPNSSTATANNRR